jgi:DNA-directed RNA polymerase sigma subunit (sigma70/sigma32)
MDQHYFSFFEIPDLIVKKGYSRKEYEEFIIKLLNKVKTRYLSQKKKDDVETPIEEMQVTDDDLVELDLFDQVMSSMQNKISENRTTHLAFIKECVQAVNVV